MEKLKLKSRAKINLGLDVVGKYENGYHKVDMVMQEIELYDTLIFTKLKKDNGIIIKCNSKSIPTGSENLIYKAIKELNKIIDKNINIKIDLKKNIPIAAGLGGGSSNAATTIKACNTLYDLNLSVEKMKEIGKKIGADVPFFIEGGCCRAKGIGEKLTKINGLKKGWIVLVKPNIGISTQKIYKQLNYPLINNHPKIDNIVKGLKSNDIYKISNELGNVLQKITLNNYSVVMNIKNKMEDTKALGSLMSGSGPTIFGIFKNYEEGNTAYKMFKKIYNETYLIRSFNGGKYGE
ncbi:MAG: 4-(cytidine 5'-diphospho)-2-C-methyl-D-erythritol kinase [Bacillota bacterium]